ncbi:MAG: cupin domain-containing protein [Candidatus Eremiobacteraeota bacterium]|nr:cupin domain-containing protein [Candidatus Eremiobacteraeota bacterium]MBC5827474.1 cupin domain-containing protein [Candidatus Eremiobacteraeota bacterium]
MNLARQDATPSIVDYDGGEALSFLGTLAIVRVDGKHTGGRFALIEGLLPQEAAPELHAHGQDETFYVLEGEITVWIGEQKRRCGPGCVAFAPAGTPHTFFVRSETARMLTLSTPAGIEDFIRDLSTPAKERRLPDDDDYPTREEIEATMARHRVDVLGARPTADQA